MSKEVLVPILLVGAVALGILFVVKKMSSNEDEWNQFREVRLGEAYDRVKNRFGSASEDFTSTADARDAGFQAYYTAAAGAGSVKLLVIRSREDAFFFGFDKDNRLVYMNSQDE